MKLNEHLIYDIRKPNLITSNRKIPARAGDLYGHIEGLQRTFGHCFASNKYLARLNGVSVRTVQDHLRQLELNCLIAVENTRRGDGSWERHIKTTGLIAAEEKGIRASMGYEDRKTPVRRAVGSRKNLCKSDAENCMGRMQTTAWGGAENCTHIRGNRKEGQEAEEIPKPHQEVGLAESISAGLKSQPDVPVAETDKPGKADASPRQERICAYSPVSTGDSLAPGKVPPPDPAHDDMTDAGQDWDGDIFSKYDLPTETRVPDDAAPAQYNETPPANPEDEEDSSDVGDGHGKRLSRGEWIVEIREKYQDLANDLKAIFKDFDWANSPEMARKFVKAVRRGALNARAILLLKLYMSEVVQERDEHGNDGTWRRPATFQALMHRQVLDQSIELCLEAAYRDQVSAEIMGLQEPGTDGYNAEIRLLRIATQNLQADQNPVAPLTLSGQPAWVFVLAAHQLGHRFTAEEKEAVPEAVLSTFNRSGINNVVDMLKDIGRTVEEAFFMPEHELRALQEQRQQASEEIAKVRQIIFGGANL